MAGRADDVMARHATVKAPVSRCMVTHSMGPTTQGTWYGKTVSLDHGSAARLTMYHQQMWNPMYFEVRMASYGKLWQAAVRFAMCTWY